MHIKYLEERQRANGQKIWVVKPPKYVQDAVGAQFETFEVRSDAVTKAVAVAEAYSDYKRGIQRDIHIPQDTVDGLVAFYKTTNEFKKLTENSKRLYQLMISTACNARVGQSNIVFGQMLLKNVSPTHSDRLYDHIKQSVSEHRAVHVCKVLRKIWFVGKRHGKVPSNPFERMGLKGLEERKVLWEPDDVRKLMDFSDKHGFQSISTLILLCYDLCQRPGDMRQLQWKHYNKGIIRFVQEKTGTEVTIPCSPRLRQRLDASIAAPEDFIVVCETTQKPYDRFLYMKYFRRMRIGAGLPDHLQIRDLRRTGATEMAEAGCTEDELRSVTGHQSRDVLRIYVRPTQKLAAAGIMKRFNNTEH